MAGNSKTRNVEENKEIEGKDSQKPDKESSVKKGEECSWLRKLLCAIEKLQWTWECC